MRADTQFDCVKPSEVVPFDHTPALVAYNAHAEAAKAGGAGAGAGPPTLDDSYGPPKRKPSFLQKVGLPGNVCVSLGRFTCVVLLCRAPVPPDHALCLCVCVYSDGQCNRTDPRPPGHRERRR